MSKFKSIASLFVNMEEDINESTPVAQTKSEPTLTPSRPSSEQSVTTNEDVKKFVEVLTNEIQESNLEGYDYLEFKDSVEELKQEGSSLDEAIKKVFIVVKSLTSVKKILDSLNHYKEVIKHNKEDFEKNVASKLTDSIKASEKEYADIQKQLKSLKERSDVLEAEIKDKQITIDKNTVAFNKAYDLIMSNLEEDRKSIIKVIGDK
jgi:gas vesicle protein